MNRTIVVNAPIISNNSQGKYSISSKIEFDGQTRDLFYEFSGVIPEPRMESFVSALLLAAMTKNYQLVCKGDLSERFFKQLATIQDIYSIWVPKLNKITVEAEKLVRREASGDEAACFFSAGVDSFHTYLMNSEQIRQLVFIKGFDFRITEGDVADIWIKDKLKPQIGKPLIEVATNLREILDELQELSKNGHLTEKLSNFELAHGSALASVAHLLPSNISRIFIPASNTYNDLTVWGSHPLLDPLFSSEGKQFIHYDCGVKRHDKLRYISSNSIVQQLLRVCPSFDKSQINCGRCEKCLRTMVSLRLLGVLEKFPIFAEKLDLARVKWISIRSYEYFWQDNLEEAEKQGTDRELINALRTASHPNIVFSFLRKVAKPLWDYLKNNFGVYRRDGKFHIKK